MPEHLAYCGARCDYCPRYIATRSDDPGQLAAVAELWHRLGLRDRVLRPEAIACQGCTASSWCRYDIAACAAGKKLNNCGECEDYPECPRLQAMFIKNAAYHKIFQTRCTPDELAQLQHASFDKRRNLDAARRERRG